MEKKRTRMMMMSGEDRISNLHPSILCHILSRLPNKQAVRTSVLSKEWRWKWKTIYTVNIYIFGRNNTIDEQRFAEKMLLVSSIKDVSLLYGVKGNDYDSRWVATWIYTLLRRNRSIESLHLLYAGILKTTLPHSLLSTNSLRQLSLELRCIYRVPPQIFFPNLIYLSLQSLQMHNESSHNNVLTFTLPLVEKITLTYCEWVNVTSMIVYAPKLTTFWYKKPPSSKRNNVANDIPIEIVGTKLVTLHCSGLPKNLIVRGSNVIDIVLSNLEDINGLSSTEECELLARIQSLLEGFSSLKNLRLSKCWLTAITQSGFPLPVFNHLRRLVMINPQYSAAVMRFDEIIRLLHATPHLKFLKIQMSETGCVDFDSDAVKSVPSCISLHLEELVIAYNFHSKAESARIISNLEKDKFDYLVAQGEVFNLPKFIIKYGASLKKVHFSNVYRKKLEGKIKMKFHSLKYSRTIQDSKFLIVENAFKY